MAAGAAAAPFLSPLRGISSESPENHYPISLFSKPLDSHDFDFMCECAARSGIRGLDLTVRPGGKVEPRLVENVLPDLINKAGKHGLEIKMIVTGILSASDPDTERILKTASSSGIKYYRLGWFD